MDDNQKRNAEHVEQVMRERGYMLWDSSDTKKRNKSSNKSIFAKMMFFIILPLSLIFVPLIISDYYASIAREKEEREKQLSSCLELASYDYLVSQEEEDVAGSNPELNLVLARRRKAGIEAKLQCYEDFGGDDQNAVNTLKADKNEVESWISLYESEMRSMDKLNNSQSTPNYTYSQTPTHCTSQQIGTSVYTNCY